MSSPAGLQYSQADFLARWMPSSTRAGVILNPCADLAGSMRHVSSVGSPHPPLEPDDSFASDFAPLPASADSSCCIGVDGFARSAGRQKTDADGPVDGRSPGPQRNTHGESESLDEMANTSQDLPLRMKLEQLRKWQQLMQEQLKAHQLEELLRLQEEQQRLLGVMNGSQDSTEGTPYHSTSACRRAQQGSACGQEQELSSAGRRTEPHTDQDHEEGSEDEGSWNSREDDEEQSVDLNQFHERDVTSKRSKAASLNGNTSVKGDTELHERPIKQGVGGQKKTFEELLEEQLRMEEQRLKSAQQQQGQEGAAAAQAPPKRVFLKRGEGLSRFTNNRKPKQAVTDEPRPQAQARVLCRSNSDPAALQRGVSNGVQRFPVRRKTATLNKENRPKGVSSPPQDAKFERTTAWTKVLGSHQRRNTDVPQPVQTDPESKGTKLHQPEQSSKRESSQALRDAGHSVKPNPVTKQVGAIRGPERGDSDAAREGGRGSSRGGGEVPQDSFEQSFQEKLQRWDCDRQVENIELGEFELLEQAAEELSFSSNSSFVLKVLQMDQLQAARGFPPRRLSSTPIKSPPKAAPQRCTSVSSSSSSSSGGGVVVQSGAVKPDVFMVKVRDGALMNGASVEERTELDSGHEDDHESCEVSSCGGSEFEYQEVGGKPPSFPSSLSFPAQSDLPYDKHSYQDEESCRDSASDVTQVDDGESDSFLSNADESTLLEDKDGRQGPVVFDDNDTWNDPEHAAVCSANDGRLSPVTKVTVSPPARTLQRKVAASKVAEAVDKGVDVSSANQEPPPASQLMTRLFPSLKPKTQNAPLPPPPPPPPPPSAASIESKKSEEDTGVQVTSRQLRERLVELEVEIERFKKENSALGKLRQENEKNQETLRKERLEFEKTRAEELAKLEEHKREENRKLQKERRLFEKHALAARAMPDKKEREEIQVLRQQLISLQEELRARESRWASTHGRLRQQIDSLNKENESLRDEVRMLEKLRLTALRKSPLNASKDAPKMFDGNASSAPKGVKFASPLDSRVSSSSSSPPQSSATAAPGKTCRESSQAAAAMKSSLRKPSLPASSSSSSLPPWRKEERPTPAPCKSQDKLRHQEKSKPSPSTEEPESCEVKEPESAREVITHPDGKVEKVLASGDRLISFPNGTRKEVSGDGLTVKVTFFNGDTKQITADQRVIYYYAETQTTHITYTDGIEVLHFPNNQTEKHFPDGRKEITFPDQTVKNLFPNGREESVLTDGTVIQVNPDGTKEIHFNTGQREIHTADFKRREYPDGTVKTVYADGRQETSYPTGRLRIKDKDGNVVVDNGV